MAPAAEGAEATAPPTAPACLSCHHGSRCWIYTGTASRMVYVSSHATQSQIQTRYSHEFRHPDTSQACLSFQTTSIMDNATRDRVDSLDMTLCTMWQPRD